MIRPRLVFAFAVATALACGGKQTMSVDRKPIADFRFIQSAVRPQVFVFDAAQSRPTVGSLAKYRWLFGDELPGQDPADVLTSTAQHAYKTPGNFTVTLAVADDKDTESDPVSKTVTVVTVNLEGPMAKITGPNSGTPGTQLTFDGSTSTPSGDLQNFAWDFGDTVTTSGKDKTIVQHSWPAAGQYLVKLTVTDSLGTSNTATLQIAIGEVGPLAVCSYMPSTVTVGTPVSFTGAQSVAPAGSTLKSYIWDFGDGTSNVPGALPGGVAQHTYTAQGTFKPKLVVYDDHMPTRRTNEAFCPDVVVGAQSLCNGDYTWRSTGSGGLCSFNATTITVAQRSDGSITLTEPSPNGTITYNGTWTGSSFHVTGAYMGQDYDLTGTFSGCGSWTGTYDTSYGGLQLCTTPVSATKI